MKLILAARNHVNLYFFACALLLSEIYLHIQIVPLQKYISSSSELLNQLHLIFLIFTLSIAFFNKIRLYSLCFGFILLVMYYLANPLLITVGLRYFLFTLIALIYISYKENTGKLEKENLAVDFLYTAIIVSHFTSGMLKIFNNDGTWLDGSAIINILESHRSSALFYKPYLNLMPAAIFSLVTYSVVIFEVMAILFLFSKKCRLQWLKVTILFHLISFILLNIADVSFPVIFSLLTLWQMDTHLVKGPA